MNAKHMVRAFNARGDMLFLNESDPANSEEVMYFETAREALEFIRTRRSALRYDHNEQRFLRNRIAQFELHTAGAHGWHPQVETYDRTA